MAVDSYSYTDISPTLILNFVAMSSNIWIQNCMLSHSGTLLCEFNFTNFIKRSEEERTVNLIQYLFPDFWFIKSNLSGKKLEIVQFKELTAAEINSAYIFCSWTGCIQFGK